MVSHSIRTCVEDLNDIDQICQLLDGRLTEVPTIQIVRVLEIDETSLIFDLERGLFRCETGRHLSPKEQAYKLTFSRCDLLPDHNSKLTISLEAESSDGSVVIGKKQGIEAK
jgi:hypothetical protein